MKLMESGIHSGGETNRIPTEDQFSFFFFKDPLVLCAVSIFSFVTGFQFQLCMTVLQWIGGVGGDYVQKEFIYGLY